MSELTQGPDPHPKKPKLTVPPGASDTHIHLFGPASKYQFAGSKSEFSRELVRVAATIFAFLLHKKTAPVRARVCAVVVEDSCCHPSGRKQQRALEQSTLLAAHLQITFS